MPDRSRAPVAIIDPYLPIVAELVRDDGDALLPWHWCINRRRCGYAGKAAGRVGPVIGQADSRANALALARQMGWTLRHDDALLEEVEIGEEISKAARHYDWMLP